MITKSAAIGLASNERALIGEGPFWDTATERLYWVDIPRRRLHRFDAISGTTETWTVDEEVGCVVTASDGGLLLALRKGFYRYDLRGGDPKPLFVTTDEPATNRFNDGKTDRQGRFWCGSLDEAEKNTTGALYRLDLDLRCTRMIEEIICSNALCWSPDGRTMYFGDSGVSTVWAWDFDPATGAIENRRVFVQIAPEHGVPDGATVDAEGFVWIAQWGGSRLVRYDPSGRIARTVMLPVSQPACPAFGGPDLATLYVTSAAIGLDVQALAQEPLAGALLSLDVGVCGIAEVPFAGVGR